MLNEDFDKDFLELESSFELSSLAFSKISGGQMAKTFWTYDETMKRKLTRKPALKEQLLRLSYKDDFKDYFGFQDLRGVLEKFYKERFVATEHPKWVALLRGDELTIPNNVIHVKTNTSFLEFTEENLKKAAKALLESWVFLPPFFHSTQPEVDFDKSVNFSVDLNSARITFLRQPKNEKYTFCIVFSTKVKLTYDFNREWNPEVYRQLRPFGEYSRFKLIWDLLNYTEKFKIERSGFELYPCLRPTTWNEFITWAGFCIAGKEGLDFMKAFRLLAELLTHGELDGNLDKLEKFQKGKFLYGVKSSSLFSRNLKEIGNCTFEYEISNVQDLLDGLKASQELYRRFLENTGLKAGCRTRIGEGLCLLIARKVAMDPVSYIDDPRPYVSEIAKAVVSGDLDISEIPEQI